MHSQIVDSVGKRILFCTASTHASNLPGCIGLAFFWLLLENASVVSPGFGHRPWVSAQVQNMRYEACMQENEAKVSANSLGNIFRNTYADYGMHKKTRSYGYPLDEDGNYPENMRWYRWETTRSSRASR